MSGLMIRDVSVDDAERLVQIYGHYVMSTAVSFEYDVPSVEEFRNRIDSISAKYPYLVCIKDNMIVGYAYAGAYSSREAYAWTATISIYVDKDCRKKGIGSLLYSELEKRLKEQGIVNLLAGIAYSDSEDEYLSHDSLKFHKKEGYYKVAQMNAIGKKFDRWYDLIWMQKKINEEEE